MKPFEIKEIIDLAKTLYLESEQQMKTSFIERIPRLLRHAKTKYFLIKLLDVSLRPKSKKTINIHIQKIIEQYPNHTALFSYFEIFLICTYRFFGYLFPCISIPLIKKKIRSVTAAVIHKIDGPEFVNHQKHRKGQGIRQNLNLIGEAILGEKEAEDRINKYKKLIENPKVDYISIKISTLYSQISNLAYNATIENIIPKLETIYRQCKVVERNTGKKTFVNLDMEEYRDLRITITLFKQILSKPEFMNTYAGIVLQAYIPDSYKLLIDLKSWAKERVRNNGSPIKIRIVKGANMEMEKIESSVKNWPLVTHYSKIQTDAQYKKMLQKSLSKENADFLHIGVASHNIFDLAFAIVIVEKHQIHKTVTFEMLEGLAENYLNSLRKRNLQVLLYTPIVEKGQFLNAIAYLIRRFDESTTSGNFIREQIGLKIGSKKWIQLEKSFLRSVSEIDNISLKPKRDQNRDQNKIHPIIKTFINSSDTDWNLSCNQIWAKELIKKWRSPKHNIPQSIPKYKTHRQRERIQIQTWDKPLPWDLILGDLVDIEKAIRQANDSNWPILTIHERAEILKDVAINIERHRSDLIGIGMLEVGKLITEMDLEISESIDFANYYAFSSIKLEEEIGYYNGKGLTLVLSPWNFPIAIPSGGIFSALATGNPVILKPSKRSATCAYLLCEYIWEAGVPKDALQFLPADSTSYTPFLKHPSPFQSIILTGGTETAQKLLKQNPYLNLYAETGGKNATIVTSFADKEQAIKNILDSAFNNSGQKCSATSLLIVEEEVYSDKKFLNLLKDAIESRKVGSPWNLKTAIGPLAHPISNKIRNELNNPSKKWLVKPKVYGDHMLSAGIILSSNVENDSSIKTELFGPLLTVIKTKDLKSAIELANKTEYGLTAGLESLNEEEICYWKKHIQAGNLYINRSTTGAIVKRQPFGGIKHSSFGPAMKAGGRNYITQFIKLATQCSVQNIGIAEKSYLKWDEKLFSKEIDEVQIRGQHNVLKYLKPSKVYFLGNLDTKPSYLRLIQTACDVLEVPLLIHFETEPNFAIIGNVIIKPFLEITFERNIRYRCINKKSLSESLLKKAYKSAVHIYEGIPTATGRIELLHYLQEQSISHDFHRYGNLMDEERYPSA